MAQGWRNVPQIAPGVCERAGCRQQRGPGDGPPSAGTAGPEVVRAPVCWVSSSQVTSSLPSEHGDKVQAPHPRAEVVPVVTHWAWCGEVTGPRRVATVTS